jgi:hypothetical protein
MRIGTLRARRKEETALEWRGRLVPTLLVEIALTGFASIFWSGEYWFRPADGRSLLAESDRGPGTKKGYIELVSEF